MTSLPRLFTLSLVLVLTSGVLVQAVAPPPVLWPLPEGTRKRLDQLAMLQPLETTAHERVNVAGVVPAWLLAHMELSAEEEFTQSQKVHDERLRMAKTVPTPALTEKVLERLTTALPLHLALFRYRLTVFDNPDIDAATPGGGFLHINRGLLDILLRDSQRGEAALAFVLAREIGHGALSHCRRGWQLEHLEGQVRKGHLARMEPSVWRDLLETKLRNGSEALSFLYSRDQEYEADLFALQLCRNAGYSIDEAIDGMRLLTVLRHPEIVGRRDFKIADAGAVPTPMAYYLSESADPLIRLRRLLMERDGLVADAEKYGLFRYERDSGEFNRLKLGDLRKGDRPIVFVHGLYGNKEGFDPFLAFLAEQPDLADRPLLAFRHPGNASLARCGLFLSNQMRLLLPEGVKPTFICHSAGGLVFRYYAEKAGGAFERAVLLGVPNGGSNLTELKAVLDVVNFGGGLRWGLDGAITRILAEGRGEIGQDLHSDSLFLRYLGRDAKLAARYHVIYAEWLSPTQALLVQVAFTELRRKVQERVMRRLPEGAMVEEAKKGLLGLRLPGELLRGDQVVAVGSARLPGAGKTTGVRASHLGLRNDPVVMRLVLADLRER